jgi:hypothetical protein
LTYTSQNQNQNGNATPLRLRFFFFTHLSLPSSFLHFSAMSDRFFPNPMPEFVPETTPSTQHELQEAVTVTTGDSLQKLLSMPHVPLSERLKRASLDLKETVRTLLLIFSFSFHSFSYNSNTPVVFLCQIVIETWGITGQRVGDFTLYSGLLGTAFLLFKSYHVTRNTNDLTLCSQIIKSCDAASLFSRFCTFCTSLCDGSV